VVGKSREVHSAICRLHRDQEIADRDKQGATAHLRLLSRGWREILPADQVREVAFISSEFRFLGFPTPALVVQPAFEDG
jgi:hypothetical protein